MSTQGRIDIQPVFGAGIWHFAQYVDRYATDGYGPPVTTLEAIELGNAYDTVSLDSRMAIEAESAPMTLAEFVGGEDETLITLQRYGDLTAAIESLEEREKVIITLRFFKDLSQAEVAKKLNISQMHVSRLQHRALENLKKLMLD